MTVKIIYFTAGAQPTGTEQGHIDTLKATPLVNLVVRNASMVGNTDETPEEADYVANATGANFPAGYTNTSDYPITTPAGAASLGLPATQMIIKSGTKFLSPAVSGSRVDGYVPTIANRAVTALAGG